MIKAIFFICHVSTILTQCRPLNLLRGGSKQRTAFYDTIVLQATHAKKGLNKCKSFSQYLKQINQFWQTNVTVNSMNQ